MLFIYNPGITLQTNAGGHDQGLESQVFVQSSLNDVPVAASSSAIMYFIKNRNCVILNSTVAAQSIDFGVIKANSLETLSKTITAVFAPCIFKRPEKCLASGQNDELDSSSDENGEFQATTQKFI